MATASAIDFKREIDQHEQSLATAQAEGRRAQSAVLRLEGALIVLRDLAAREAAAGKNGGADPPAPRRAHGIKGDAVMSEPETACPVTASGEA